MSHLIPMTTAAAQQFESLKQVRTLKEKLAKTGEQDITGKIAPTYGDIPQSTWDLVGVTCAFSEKSQITEAALRHQSFFQDAQNRLLLLREEITQFTTRVVGASNPQSLFQTLSILQNATRAQVETCVNLFNTKDPTVGYIFNGAQTDIPPLDHTIVKDLSQSPPHLSKGSIAAYFTNGITPGDQLPLRIGENASFTLPIQAYDLQGIFQVFHDFIALEPKNANEKLLGFRSAMDPSLITIDNAILTLSHIIETLGNEIEQADSGQSLFKDREERLANVDPIQTATQFYGEAQAMQSLLHYIALMLKLERDFGSMLGNS